MQVLFIFPSGDTSFLRVFVLLPIESQIVAMPNGDTEWHYESSALQLLERISHEDVSNWDEFGSWYHYKRFQVKSSILWQE